VRREIPLFVNEEPPYFATSKMGSRVWAEEAHRRGERVVGMLSLETLGFFSDAPHSQRYPFPMGAFYPDRGQFLGFIGNIDSRQMVREVIGSFREVASIPSEGAALPDHTMGVGWSDHASFWRFGWPALMVTDTALFRYAHYHTARDRPEQVDVGALARAAVGLEHAVRALSSRSRAQIWPRVK
jgi:Peptidase family M28